MVLTTVCEISRTKKDLRKGQKSRLSSELDSGTYGEKKFRDYAFGRGKSLIFQHFPGLEKVAGI